MLPSKTLSQLPAAATLDGSELVLGFQDGAPVHITTDQIAGQSAARAAESAASAVEALSSQTIAQSSAATALDAQAAVLAAQTTVLGSTATAVASASSASASDASAQASKDSATQSETNALTYQNASSVNANAASASASAAATSAGTSTAQAGLAGSYAASASSVVQQDLSGVTAQALHRSPNAVVAMFVYDASKDSDGGAWTDKCQGTSWFNEALNGAWLGAQASELAARGDNLVAFPEDLTNASWIKTGVTIPAVNTLGTLDTILESAVGSTHFASSPGFNLTTGLPYTVSADAKIGVGSRLFVINIAGGAPGAIFNLTNGTIAATFPGSATNVVPSITSNGDGTFSCSISFVSGFTAITNVRMGPAVDLSTAQPNYVGDGTSTILAGKVKVNPGSVKTPYVLNAVQAGQFFQLTTDGKFYSLGANYGTTTEVFRGNTAKFPRLAAIVAESNSLTIYDLTQPGRPMWMRFVTNGAFNGGAFGFGHLGADGNAPISSIAALNGKICATQNVTGNAEGVRIVDFITDVVDRISDSARGNTWRFNGNIAQRNQQLLGRFQSSVGIINLSANAVSMTVMPDAPIDPFTSLPIPTIVVGTAGGISLLKHDGTVVNSVAGNFTFVDITPQFIASKATSSGVFISPNPGTLAAGFGTTTIAQAAAPGFAGDASQFSTVNLSRLGHRGSWLISQPPIGSGPRIGGARLNESSLGSSLCYAIGSSFNTGMWAGDNRRCLLSSNQAGAITGGTNIVTDGTFDSVGTAALYGKQDNNISLTVSGGVLTTTTNISAGSNFVYFSAITEPGVQYTVTATCAVLATATGGYFDIRDGAAAGAGGGQLNNSGNFNAGTSATGAITTTFIAGGSGITSIRLAMAKTQNDASMTWDNFSCVVTGFADRSYKIKPIRINGTITKTAVAAAAQLVADSGFSAANYLQEAYSADLDFGTGAWSADAWVNIPAVSPSDGFPVIGPELTTNGDFSAGATSWTVSGADATHIATFSGGTLRFQSDTITPILVVSQSLPTVGKWYEMVVVCSAWTSGSLKIDGNTTTGAVAVIADSVGTKTIRFQSTGSLNIYRNSPSVDLTLDSISIKEIGYAVIVDRSAAAGAYSKLGIDQGGKLVGIAYDGTTTRTVTSPFAYNTASWLKANVVYTTDGALTLYANGEQVAQATGAALLTMNNAAAVLTVGNSRTLDAAFPGSIALVKIGATAPSIYASRFMFTQEAEMFRPGAQVTLPDTGAIVDMDYDPSQNKWKVASFANESGWAGLVRTDSAPVSAGSFTKVSQRSGVKLLARSTTNPGVDVTIPAYGLREEMYNRAERAAALSKSQVVFDYDAITGQTDFVLPLGYTAVEVISAGASKREGATKDWTRLYDGFIETVRFGVAPGNATWVQITARKSQ